MALSLTRMRPFGSRPPARLSARGALPCPKCLGVFAQVHAFFATDDHGDLSGIEITLQQSPGRDSLHFSVAPSWYAQRMSASFKAGMTCAPAVCAHPATCTAPTLTLCWQSRHVVLERRSHGLARLASLRRELLAATGRVRRARLVFRLCGVRCAAVCARWGSAFAAASAASPIADTLISTIAHTPAFASTSASACGPTSIPAFASTFASLASTATALTLALVSNPALALASARVHTATLVATGLAHA